MDVSDAAMRLGQALLARDRLTAAEVREAVEAARADVAAEEARRRMRMLARKIELAGRVTNTEWRSRMFREAVIEMIEVLW